MCSFRKPTGKKRIDCQTQNPGSAPAKPVSIEINWTQSSSSNAADRSLYLCVLLWKRVLSNLEMAVT